MKNIIKISIILWGFGILCYGSLKNGEIDTFKYGTEREKIALLEKLILTNNKIYLPEIGKLLDDPSREVRSKAVYTLLKIGDSTCIPYFKKAFRDSWWQVRLYGMEGLVRYGGKNVIDEFINGLDDSYWKVRYYAAIGLGKYGDENVIEDLIEHINDENIMVQEEILWALNRILWRDEAKAKFKRLSESKVNSVFEKVGSKSESIRIRTIWVIEASEDVRGIPYLIKLLGDESKEVKIRAIWALEKLKAKNAGYAIEALLEDPSVKVKIESIKALSRLKSEESIEGLVKKLKDPDENVRIYALWALERFKNPLTYDGIVNCLKDQSRKVREYAIKVIEELNDKNFIPFLKKIVSDENTDIEAKLSGLKLLGKIGDEETGKFLLNLTRCENPAVRKGAVEALFMIDKFNPDFLKQLCFMESFDPDWRVRKTSSRLLAKVIGEMENMVSSSEEKEKVLQIVESLQQARNLRRLLKSMAESEYPELREKMVELCLKKPYPELSKNLREMFEEPDIVLKRKVALVLGEIKDKKAIPLLKNGLKSYDTELQLNCAYALAKMGRRDGLPIALNLLRSDNVEFQKRSAEILALLRDKKTSDILLKKLANSELEVKVVCAWALARMGEIKGAELLVKLSEENIEPVRTYANQYLSDPSIPYYIKAKIPKLREEFRRSRIGIIEISPKIAKAYHVDGVIIIDGKDEDRFWKIIEKEDNFLTIDEKVNSDYQTKVGIGYDDKYIYFLVICEDPDTSQIELKSRDFITVSINPKNSFKEWYQFVVHPLGVVNYSYIWKFYKDDEPEKKWESSWKVKTSVEEDRWIAEIAIPLSDLKVDKITSGTKWGINFHRDSERIPPSTWTGRIDNPEQFGVLIFE